LWQIYSASHHNRIDTGIFIVWTGPPIQDGRSHIRAGLIAGLSLSLAMIQENCGVYVTAAVGQELLSGKLGQA
jgi:hypothetical protein